MHHVIGISPREQKYLWPLRPEPRLRFSTRSFHSDGYFRLLVHFFEPFAQRESGQSLFSINTLVALRGSDLDQVGSVLNEAEGRISALPAMWREYLGDLHPPRKAPVIRIEPMLFRARASRMIGKVRSLVEVAKAQADVVVYGNGVPYRHLCGIPSQPDVVEYS